MKIPCSSCNQRLEIPEELAGQTIECPACNASLAVPALTATPSATPQVQITPQQEKSPKRSVSKRKSLVKPKTTSKKKSKPQIAKWAIISIAGLAVVVVGLIIFSPDDSDDQDAALQSNRLEELEDSASKLSDVLDRTSEMTDQLKKNLAIPYLSIHDAAGKGNIEAVKQYLAAGTDVNEKSVLTKQTPLYWAVRAGQKEIVELLIEAGADLNAKSGLHDETALYKALDNEEFDIADIIRNNGGKFGTIFQAAQYGDVKSLKEFLDLGADINGKGDILKGTALHYAAFGENFEIVKFLINAGAEVNVIDEDGKTPVRYTFNEEILKLLVAKGADINLKIKGKTRLDNAVLYGNSDLANILRKHGGKTAEELKSDQN